MSKNDSIIYQVSELCGKNVINGTLKKEIEKIISEHKGEYDVIHGHEPNAAFIYFKAAEKYGIGVVYFTVIMQKVLTWQLKVQKLYP